MSYRDAFRQTRAERKQKSEVKKNVKAVEKARQRLNKFNREAEIKAQKEEERMRRRAQKEEEKTYQIRRKAEEKAYYQAKKGLDDIERLDSEVGRFSNTLNLAVDIAHNPAGEIRSRSPRSGRPRRESGSPRESRSPRSPRSRRDSNVRSSRRAGTPKSRLARSNSTSELLKKEAAKTDKRPSSDEERSIHNKTGTLSHKYKFKFETDDPEELAELLKLRKSLSLSKGNVPLNAGGSMNRRIRKQLRPLAGVSTFNTNYSIAGGTPSPQGGMPRRGPLNGFQLPRMRYPQSPRDRNQTSGTFFA